MKAIKKYSILSFILTLFVFASCDYIDKPIQGGGIVNPPDSTTEMRTILIDDFTGQRCVNCPEAAEAIEDIKNNPLFEGRVVSIGVHYGFFANPLPPQYPADFRTPEGNGLGTVFGPNSFPTGMVNRIDYPNNHLKAYSEWINIAAQFLDSTAIFKIYPTVSYNSTTRSLQVDAQVNTHQNRNGVYNIVVLVTEDAIVSEQLTHSGRDTAYVHNHVLRTSTNTEIGEPIVNGQVLNGDKISYSSGTIILSTDYEDKNCHVVIYIYDTATQEILEVTEAKLL